MFGMAIPRIMFLVACCLANFGIKTISFVFVTSPLFSILIFAKSAMTFSAVNSSHLVLSLSVGQQRVNCV